MTVNNENLKKYKSELVKILIQNKDVTLNLIRTLAPKDTGLMARSLELRIKETSSGFSIDIIGHEDEKNRVKNGRTYAPRAYFFPNNNIQYMGPRSLKLAGKTDKKGKVIQPFIKLPIEKAIQDAINKVYKKYKIQLRVI